MNTITHNDIMYSLKDCIGRMGNLVVKRPIGSVIATLTYFSGGIVDMFRVDIASLMNVRCSTLQRFPYRNQAYKGVILHRGENLTGPNDLLVLMGSHLVHTQFFVTMLEWVRSKLGLDKILMTTPIFGIVWVSIHEIQSIGQVGAASLLNMPIQDVTSFSHGT